MKAFVLMSKASGVLTIGYRVAFLDTGRKYDGYGNHTVSLYMIQHDGWVIEFPPDVSLYPLFFNLESEKMFENLGEL